MASKLSETMEQALVSALEQGCLVRWPGGWWTIPGCPSDHQQPSIRHGALSVPPWSVGVGTVHALVTRGYLQVVERDPKNNFETKVVPTEKARSLI